MVKGISLKKESLKILNNGLIKIIRPQQLNNNPTVFQKVREQFKDYWFKKNQPFLAPFFASVQKVI